MADLGEPEPEGDDLHGTERIEREVENHASEETALGGVVGPDGFDGNRRG